LDLVDPLGKLRPGFRDDRAARHVGMSAQVFGRGMHDQIRAEIQRPLNDRRPCVIAGADRARAVSDLRDRGNVGNLQKRIRRRLDPHEFCFRRHRARDLFQLCHVDEGNFEAPPHIDFAEQLGHSVINVGRCDDVISGCQRLQDGARGRQT
jgi:hypothetical protein